MSKLNRVVWCRLSSNVALRVTNARAATPSFDVRSHDEEVAAAVAVQMVAVSTDEAAGEYPDSPPPRYSFIMEDPSQSQRSRLTTGGESVPRLDPPEWDSMLHGVELEYKDLCDRVKQHRRLLSTI